MKSSPTYSWLIAVPAFIMSTTEIYPAKPAVIHGRIELANSGKIVENAYIFIVPGEEEALSGKDGSFTISTWQELPVTLVVEHPKFKSKKIVIQDHLKKQTIQLEPK